MNYFDFFKNVYLVLSNPHNNLRISRILECLGIFELYWYQNEFIRFLLHEIFQTRELEKLDETLVGYWIHRLKDENEKADLIQTTKQLIENLYK